MPRSGAVGPEYGPAMMWNTAYGMHRARVDGVSTSSLQARQIAQAWLADNRPAEQAGQAETLSLIYRGYAATPTRRTSGAALTLRVEYVAGLTDPQKIERRRNA